MKLRGAEETDFIYFSTMPDRIFPATPASLWTTRLDRSLPTPLSRQLAVALREALSEGRIDAGARLPSTRAPAPRAAPRPQTLPAPAAPRLLSRRGERLRAYRAPAHETLHPFELGHADI